MKYNVVPALLTIGVLTQFYCLILKFTKHWLFVLSSSYSTTLSLPPPPPNCVIFALGISGAISFEEDPQIYSENRCRVISVDSGKQKDEVIASLENIGGTVVEAVIAPSDNGTKRSMESILKENGVDEVEILKVDIEGAEFGVIEDFLDSYIVSQVHRSPQQTLWFLRMITSKEYLLFHHEINERFHQLCEHAFIHESRLHRYNAFFLAKYY